MNASGSDNPKLGDNPLPAISLSYPGLCTSVDECVDSKSQCVKKNREWKKQVEAADVNLRAQFEKIDVDKDCKIAFYHGVISGISFKGIEKYLSHHYSDNQLQMMVDHVAEQILTE
jgi:hypothetical protein